MEQAKTYKIQTYILNSIEKTEERAAVNVDLMHSDGSIDKLQILFEFVDKKFYDSAAIGIMRNFKNKIHFSQRIAQFRHYLIQFIFPAKT